MLNKEDISKVIKAFGLVFGDIGTSPIYTITVIFILLKPTIPNIMGILSLIFWTLTLLITVKYSWLAMSLGKRGEGGTIVLRELLLPLLKKTRSIALVTILTLLGISLLIGDGVITPAISILSAVEGIRLIPGCSNINQPTLITVAAIIAIILFSFQRKGTEKVTKAFGPIMVVWFLALSLFGILSIIQFPQVVNAINPYYAIKFMLTHGFAGFFILSEVILCATGGEALYADMGHLGKVPIIRAWSVTFIALAINYFGQGAYLALHPDSKNVLFEMVLNHSHMLYVPFLLLSIMATVIASQAMISGMFSIIYQGITTRLMPILKVEYTSVELRTQIYIATVNWFLLAFVLIVMMVFQESSNLAAAYGLAVIGTMTITSALMIWIFILRKSYIKAFIASSISLVDLAYLGANIFKIPHGGYWSLLIASIPFIIILIYNRGQRKLYQALNPLKLETFLETYLPMYRSKHVIDGTALFFLRDPKAIPPYIANTMFNNKIIYKDNILVSITTIDKPFGITSGFKEDVSDGLRFFKINIGYMEVVDLEKIMQESGINEDVIFYGLEEIMTENPVWKVFAMIKNVTPSFVKFYTLASNKLHGVVTRVNM